MVLYLIMYMLMFSAAIYLRYNMKKSNRPFRIGGKGNGMMWFIGGLGFLGSLLAFVLSFIPPSQISVGSNAVWFSVLIIGTLVVVIAPFIIYASRKPSWTNKDSQFEPFHWEEGATAPAASTAPTGTPADQTTTPKTAAPVGNTTTTTQSSSSKPTPGNQPGTPANSHLPGRAGHVVAGSLFIGLPPHRSPEALENRSGPTSSVHAVCSPR